MLLKTTSVSRSPSNIPSIKIICISEPSKISNYYTLIPSDTGKGLFFPPSFSRSGGRRMLYVRLKFNRLQLRFPMQKIFFFPLDILCFRRVQFLQAKSHTQKNLPLNWYFKKHTCMNSESCIELADCTVRTHQYCTSVGGCWGAVQWLREKVLSPRLLYACVFWHLLQATFLLASFKLFMPK